MNKEFRTNFDYRQYMIRNGPQHKAHDQTIFCQYGNNEKKQPSKYLFQHNHDPNQPFGFESSDLKANYIQRQSYLLVPSQLNNL